MGGLGEGNGDWGRGKMYVCVSLCVCVCLYVCVYEFVCVYQCMCFFNVTEFYLYVFIKMKY